MVKKPDTNQCHQVKDQRLSLQMMGGLDGKKGLLRTQIKDGYGKRKR